MSHHPPARFRQGPILAALLGGALAAASVPGTALAAQAPAVYDKCVSNVNGIPASPEPRSCAFVATSGIAPNGQYSGNAAAVGNGFTDTANTYGQLGGTGSTNSSADGWGNTAESTSNTGSTASASSDLHTGTLHSTLASNDGFFRGAMSNVRIADGLTFHNASGQVALISLGYTVDGQFIPGPNGYDGFTDTKVFLILNSPDRSIVTSSSGTPIGSTAESYFDARLGYHTNTSTLAVASDYQYTARLDLGTGLVSGGYLVGLALPVGDSRLDFSLTMQTFCNAAGGQCDFGHTGAFTLGALPVGVSFDSASGVLFAPAAAVPEPATLASLMLGLGLVGVARGRRRNGAGA